MNTPPEQMHPSELSTHRLKMFRVTLVALATAVLIFVIAILPAEYGIDPLRTGKSLGFSALYQEENDAGDLKTSALIITPSSYLTDTQEMILEPGKGIEYKYFLNKGSTMLFSWTATSYLRFDFHGEPTGGAPGYFESHEIGVSGEGHGTFVAPFTGTHGWYWENQSIDPVTILLSTAGHYTIVGIKN